MKKSAVLPLLCVFMLARGSDIEKEQIEQERERQSQIHRLVRVSSAPDSLPPLYALTHISLFDQMLTNDQFRTMINVATLAQHIAVSNNRISRLLNGIRPSYTLNTLDISNNKLTDPVYLPEWLALFPQLTALNISDNAIESLNVNTIEKKSHHYPLKKLCARNTHCTFIDIEALYYYFDHLQHIDISDSQRLAHTRFIQPCSSPKKAPSPVLTVVARNTRLNEDHWNMKRAHCFASSYEYYSMTLTTVCAFLLSVCIQNSELPLVCIALPLLLQYGGIVAGKLYLPKTKMIHLVTDGTDTELS